MKGTCLCGQSAVVTEELLFFNAVSLQKLPGGDRLGVGDVYFQAG